MKRTYTLLLLGFLLIFTNAQTQTDNRELEYPFAEPGKEITRGVFGNDDRKEIKDAEGFKDFARATAVMISKRTIRNKEFYSYSLRERLTRQFGTDKFDDNVRFLEQPALASCTGFLIAPDILVTAGHCINSMEKANEFVWVFDYTSETDFMDGRRLKFSEENIYEVESIISSEFDDYDDYAVLRLKRKSDRNPYRYRTSGKVLNNSSINTIGSPTGLPLKLADNSKVVNNSPEKWFKSNIDSFPGNSGGPVFDPYGFIEGILVRGAVTYSNGKYTGDYMYDSFCDCIKTVNWETVDYTGGCQAHKITAIPSNVLLMGVYENLQYAIMNNINDRFDAWSIYKWIFNHDYSKSKERLDYLALSFDNLYALDKILNYTSEKMSDADSRRMIDLAAKKYNTSALQILLDNDILADAGIESPYTALQEAILNKKNAVARLLISYGADVTVETANKDNLLHFAAKTGNSEIVGALLDLGLSPAQENLQGYKPENVAKINKNEFLSRYLKKARKGKL